MKNRPSSASGNRSEFEWEREIRRDERRISRYYYELASCLDLPGEEEIIYNELAGHSDLVPAAGGKGENFLENPRRRFFDRDDDDDDDEAPRDPAERRPGAETTDEIDYLASEWSILAANRLRADLRLPGLGISCAYGKLLARAIDFSDADPRREYTLKLCLGKRVLNDINQLLGMLEAFGAEQPSLAADLDAQRRQLIQLREKCVDLLIRLRSQSPGSIV